MSVASSANAAPVPGFEALYGTLISSCSLPDGTIPACEAAINAYASALVGAVDLDAANLSFSAARLEVFELNAVDEEFQASIDALFELLLPESGAIGPVPSPT